MLLLVTEFGSDLNTVEFVHKDSLFSEFNNTLLNSRKQLLIRTIWLH